MLVPDIWQMVTNVGVEAFANKLGSQSGEERTAWNAHALISFVDTMGMGAGLGAVRASSFVVALLANTGIAGTLLFMTFAYRLYKPAERMDMSRPDEAAIGRAALMSALSQIFSATIAGTSTDLGLLFSLVSGLAAGAIARAALTHTSSASHEFVAPHQRAGGKSFA